MRERKDKSDRERERGKERQRATTTLQGANKVYPEGFFWVSLAVTLSRHQKNILAQTKCFVSFSLQGQTQEENRSRSEEDQGEIEGRIARGLPGRT